MVNLHLTTKCALNIIFMLVILLCISRCSESASSRRTSISCYECNSRNFSNPLCHDPVHPAGVTLKDHCKVAKKNHVGLFPALYCVKMIGKSRRSQDQIVIRTCALESMDNSCGVFKYEDESFEGCILTCNYDGCNSSLDVFTHSHLFIMMTLMVQVMTSLTHSSLPFTLFTWVSLSLSLVIRWDTHTNQQWTMHHLLIDLMELYLQVANLIPLLHCQCINTLLILLWMDDQLYWPRYFFHLGDSQFTELINGQVSKIL